MVDVMSTMELRRENEREARQRELDALRKDAERYRKLVASGKYCAASIGGGWGLGGKSTKAQLDAAADALPAVGAA